MNSTQTNSLTSAFFVLPVGTLCFTYTLYDPINNLPATTVPPYASMISYPSLAIGPTVGGEIGTAAQLVFNFRIRCLNTVSNVATFQTLALTILNECTSATLTPYTVGNFFVYTVLGAQQVNSLTSFTNTGISTCFLYSLYLADGITLATLP